MIGAGRLVESSSDDILFGLNMSNLLYIYDQQFQKHLTPGAHPESPSRLAAIENALHRSELIKEIQVGTPRMASPDELCSVHDAAYIEELETTGKKVAETGGTVQLDLDTFMSPESFRTAKLAAGAGLVALDAVARGQFSSSFVAVRPPGHHALVDKPMGFCLFNNVAVAARYAQKMLSLKRVLIIDWDVHHGNGTQDMFYDDPSVCFISFHQYPLWPFTGWYTEDGNGEGKGYNINIPLPAGTGDRGYLKAWESIVEPIGEEFNPDLILLSAGYDAHQFDPLGQQQISTDGYQRLSSKLADLAERTGSKLVVFLEGGYNTQTLAESAINTMSVLNAPDADHRQASELFGTTHGGAAHTKDRSVDLVDERIEGTRKHFSKYWKSLRTRASVN